MMFSRIIATASVLGLLGAFGAAGYYKFEGKLTEQQLAVSAAQNALYKSVHDQDMKALRQLAEFRAADEKVQAVVAQQIAQINDKFGASNVAIERLRKENASIEKYLRECVPAPLRDILNDSLRDKAARANSANASGQGKAAVKPDSALRQNTALDCG